GDTAPDTAVGVFHGIRGASRHAFGSEDLHGRTVFVQGAGGVGRPLISMLQQAGASVIATDVDPARLDLLRAEGINVVAPGKALTTRCDVLAPCATGAVLSSASIPDLKCRIVAGAANNQLEKPSDADLLRERGIVYAPDFVINSGGVLHGGGLEEQGWSRETLDQRLAGIGDAIYEILQAAERDGINTDAAARRIAMARIAAVPAGEGAR
ncbi:MAG: Glu/Leu/Phe/Val dehydrogenase family protein, partial [Candidatus Dormibacteraceae bacterium]